MRAAPIVCPEESPLPASVYDNYAVRRFAAGGLAHRLRRGSLANFSVQRCPKCERKALWCARRRIPLLGLDAPTPAREQGLQPYGAFTLFFRWRKKSVQKKASGTATPGKRLLLPILMAGLAMSRAMKLDSFHKLLERARARLFPPSKWAGLFPSAAYRRSAPPQVALGRLKWRRLGCFAWLG